MESWEEIKRQNKDLNANFYEKFLLENQTNSFLYLTCLFDYVNFLTVKKDYESIIKVLEKPLQDNFIQNKNDRLEIVNKLINVLLKVEDFAKLKTALVNREDLITKESDLLMQKFFYAVCYEGLNENFKAIKVLESIIDNISNRNLVNKYLKLSMLYLKVNDYDLAKKFYNIALNYDKVKKNPTFLLAECDLLYQEKNFLKALEVYQDYFIKTNNKYRYLDRYINIQIELNQLAEAYDFYQKHLGIMKRVLSKQSRLKFYQAAVKLMKRLKNQKELAKLEGLILGIQDSLTPLNNLFDYMLNFLTNNYDKQFLRKREIIHALFKEVNQTRLFSKLVYVKLEDGIVKIKHFTKGLLLEKELDLSVGNNVYRDLLKSEGLSLYDETMLKDFKEDPFLKESDKYIMVKEIFEFEYFVFYSKGNDFYNVLKCFELNAIVARKLITDYDNHGFNLKLLKNLMDIFDQEEYGLFLLKENNLHLLNKTAKSLLSSDKDYLSMEDFQGRLIKNIYVDELILNNSITLKYQADDIVSIDFQIFKDDLDIYLLGRKEKKKIITRKYHDYRYLLDEVIGEDNSIILFNLRNYQDFMKDYSYMRYDNLMNTIYEVVRVSARNYYQNLYLEGMDNLYLILKTKDKRIIKRIYEDVFKATIKDVDIRASLVYLKNRVAKSDLEDLKYLNALTSTEIRFLQDNKNYRTNREVARTILENVNKILEEINIKLSYQLIVNWQTNKYRLIYVDVLNRILLGNKDSLVRVIKANNLETRWDDLIVSTLVKEVRLANYKGKFLVDLNVKTLDNQVEMQKIVKRLSNKSFNRSEVVYVLDYQEFVEKDILELNHLKIGFKNVLANFKLKDLEVLNLAEYVILDAEEVELKACDYLLQALRELEIKIIYNHKKTSLTKSFLETKQFTLVMGEAYNKYDSLKQVKKLED
ncbi:MAG: hypothetical protein RQ856_03480 [Candidatus Izemoplasmatales bacterium]|nr:hypothetical protein [Candidatus Izemoplasmatales bacterium]